MAYDNHLADRIRNNLSQKGIKSEEKKMMGGLCFMVHDKMCVGIVKDDLMARIGKENYEEAMTKPGCRPMDFTGKPLTGFVFVSPEGIDNEDQLDYWIDLCLAFNPKAKSSKKK